MYLEGRTKEVGKEGPKKTLTDLAWREWNLEGNVEEQY